MKTEHLLLIGIAIAGYLYLRRRPNTVWDEKTGYNDTGDAVPMATTGMATTTTWPPMPMYAADPVSRVGGSARPYIGPEDAYTYYVPPTEDWSEK